MATKYLTKKTYGEKLLDPRWQKIRLKVFERDDFTCVYCGDKESTLHVHHEDYIGSNPWETPLYLLNTTCEDCHSVLHLDLTKLEKFLIFCLRNRDFGDITMSKMLSRIITGIKTNNPEYKDF